MLRAESTVSIIGAEAGVSTPGLRAPNLVHQGINLVTMAFSIHLLTLRAHQSAIAFSELE
jgi:hypothetical protein